MKLGQGLARGGRRAVIHLLKAGVEVLKGVEALLEELSNATRGAASDAPGEEQGPQRIPLD